MLFEDIICLNVLLVLQLIKKYLNPADRHTVDQLLRERAKRELRFPVRFKVKASCDLCLYRGKNKDRVLELLL